MRRGQETGWVIASPPKRATVMEIRIRRIYEEPAEGDGLRVLVDRLWPRGLSRERAVLDLWVRDLAPSDDLRRWYGHDPDKWDGFRRRYFTELDGQPQAVAELEDALADSPVVTLLFGSREEKLNNATALREYLHQRQGEGKS